MVELVSETAMTDSVLGICPQCHGKKLFPVVRHDPARAHTQLLLRDCPVCDGKGSIEVATERELKPPTIEAVF